MNFETHRPPRSETEVDRPAPRNLTDALDASVRDLASGVVGYAGSVQTEARRLLAEYDRAYPGAPGAAGHNTPKRPRTA